MSANIVVIGAGVTGLTTAWLLARSGRYEITMIAKHMPGDYDTEYASPWAGANHLPVARAGTPEEGYERYTWTELAKLAKDVPEAGVHFQDTFVYGRKKDAGTVSSDWFKELAGDDPWYKDLLPNYRKLSKSELPRGMDAGKTFTSVCMNTGIYLSWLASQCLKHGVVIKRGIVKHVADASHLHHSGKQADLVINCTGLSSLKLGGVEDTALYPGRGQIVLVRNELPYMISTSGTDDASDEALYTMTRAAGGGCILGGCMQKHNWDGQPDLNLANRIMKRAVDLCPDLVPEGKGIDGLSVIRHGVGLRPMRDGGIRIEKETITGPDGKHVKVVHNYGHGGYGYQTSFGCAQAAEKLVVESLQPEGKL